MSKFPYTLFVIPSIGDGSCFLHSVLRAISPDYTEKNTKERIEMVIEVRKDLAEMIDKPVEGSEGKTYYELLSRGQLKELSETFDEIKLEEMKKFLRSKDWFSLLYVELISNVFDIDIYIINHCKKNLYVGDNELLFKNRKSIIIGYHDEKHFDTLSIKDKNGEKRTYFSPTSPVIDKLKLMLYKEKK